MDRLLSHTFFDSGESSVNPRIITAVCNMVHSKRLSKRHKQSQWVLDYSMTYSGRSRVKSVQHPWFERPRGIGNLYPPGRFYWEDTRNTKEDVISAYIIFTGGELVGLNRLVENETGYARIFDHEEKLETLLRQIAKIGWEEKDAGFCKAQAVLYNIMDLLLKGDEEKPGTINLRDVTFEERITFADQVKEILEKNFRDALNLKQLAKTLSVSSSSLSHRYQNETGESPIQTLKKIRVEQAKSYILKGFTLKETAEITGFYDEFHLSKAFKSIIGLSPKNYLKSFK